MTEKTKKVLVIAAGSVLCLALVLAIGSRFGVHGHVPSSDGPDLVQNTKDPVVSIKDADRPDKTELVVDIKPPEQTSDPAAGADNSGTEQTIQATPVKPEEPEPPKAPTEASQSGEHSGEDVPEAERNTAQPPEYEQPPVVTAPVHEQPAAGNTNSAGQVYVPGFGWIESQGEGTIIHDETIYENGNKVGIMG